jgi:hypothetical protein
VLQTIQKLKERLTQLDSENTALVHASKTFSSAELVDKNLDAQALYDEILNLKTRLLHANEHSERPVDIGGT